MAPCAAASERTKLLELRRKRLSGRVFWCEADWQELGRLKSVGIRAQGQLIGHSAQTRLQFVSFDERLAMLILGISAMPLSSALVGSLWRRLLPPCSGSSTERFSTSRSDDDPDQQRQCCECSKHCTKLGSIRLVDPHAEFFLGSSKTLLPFFWLG